MSDSRDHKDNKNENKPLISPTHHRFGPMVPAKLRSDRSVISKNSVLSMQYEILHRIIQIYSDLNKKQFPHLFGDNSAISLYDPTGHFLEFYRHQRLAVNFNVKKATDSLFQALINESKKSESEESTLLKDENAIKLELAAILELVQTIEEPIQNLIKNVKNFGETSLEWAKRRGWDDAAEFAKQIDRHTSDIIVAVFTPVESSEKLQERMVNYISQLIQVAYPGNKNPVNAAIDYYNQVLKEIIPQLNEMKKTPSPRRG